MVAIWSISRDQALRVCERRYCFQYLVPARTNSRDRLLREVAFLKKLKTISMWQGELFHFFAAEYLSTIGKGLPLRLGDLLDRMRRRAECEWRFSANRLFRKDLRAINQQKGVALFEHEYDEPIAVDCPCVVESLERMAGRFISWIQSTGLTEALVRAKSKWIEPPVYGSSATCFTTDGVQVTVKVDLALVSDDETFSIYDWKTSTQVPHTERIMTQDSFQAAVYQLWPHLGLGYPLHSIRAYVVFVGADPVCERSFCLDQNNREYILSVVRRGATRAACLEKAFRNGDLRIDEFDLATSSTHCRWCSFKRICQRMVGE